jgi:hypothetical protein
MSILMPHGTYTVKLSVDGQELSQPLIVRKDPNSGGTEADISTQMTMLFDLRKDLESGSQMVNQIELIRSQLLQLTATLEGSSNSTSVKSAADASRVDSQAETLRPRSSSVRCIRSSSSN